VPSDSTDPPRLAGWKSLHHKFNPPLTFHVALPAPPTAPNPGEAHRPYFEDDFSSEYARCKPATPEVPLGCSVRSRQPSLRNVCRRASPNAQNPCEPCVFRNSESPRGEVISNVAHRFAFAYLDLSLATRRSSFTRARRVLELPEIFISRFRYSPRCVLPTTATHYLTNCTRARGFLGLFEFP
jgi:hypothetical protein